MMKNRKVFLLAAAATIPFICCCLLPLYITGTKDNSPEVHLVVLSLFFIAAFAGLFYSGLRQNCGNRVCKTCEPGKYDLGGKWIFLIVLAEVFFLTSSFYADITCTQNRGIDLYYSILSGNGFQKYIYESVFYIPLHILVGLWSLPFVILQLLGINMQFSTVAVLWAKLLFVLIALACVKLYKKLLEFVDSESEDFWMFMLCASPLFFMPVFAWGFYDQFELLFGLWAFLQAAREDKLSWKTLILLSIAVSIKALFLFPAVLLILVKEKRVIFILRNCALIAVIPAAFFTFFVIGGLGIADPALDSLLSVVLLPKTFPGIIDMPLFFLVYFVLCILAFFYIRPCAGKSFVLNFSWLASACYLALLLLTNHAHPQWSVLLIPFLLLLTAGGKRPEKERLILSSTCQLSLIVTQFYVFAEGICLNDFNFQGLVLKSWEARTYHGLNISSFGNLVDYFGLEEYMSIVPAAALASAAVLLLGNIPWRVERTEICQDNFWKTGRNGISVLLLVFLYSCFIFTFLIAAII